MVLVSGQQNERPDIIDMICLILFFSGIDFEGATVGLAFIGTLCSGHSVGVVQVS